MKKSKVSQNSLNTDATASTSDPMILKRLKHLVAPHVESYNYFITTGLQESTADIPPMEIQVGDDLSIKAYYTTDCNISWPTKNDSLTNDNKLTPREAREREMSYTGGLVANLKIELSTGNEFNLILRCGDFPIMVKSERCHLNHLTPLQLIAMKEEETETGGYFIVNGIERVIRLLQVPRRNFPMAIERSSYKKRGPYYSDKGITMRCVRNDQTAVTLTLHFLTNGSATLRFALKKQEFLIPVVIIAKALYQITDKELYDRIIQNNHDNTFLTTRLELLLRDAKQQYNISSQSQAAAFLGSHFRQFLPVSQLSHNDEKAGFLLLERYIFVHVDDFGSKLECLIFMIRKLFAFAQGNCSGDNADALMNHEILLPGHLLTMYVKEKFEDNLINLKQIINREYRINPVKTIADLSSTKFYQKHCDRYCNSIGNKISSFLSTGNIMSSTGLDLMQVSGYTIVAERLNMHRYYSHYQSVHRGQFFTTMKTTTVRKLLPESWGFLCPVHTPDGSPCGLLNHLTRDCVILAYPTSEKLPNTSNNEVLLLNGNQNNMSNLSTLKIDQLNKIVSLSKQHNQKGNYWAVGNDLRKTLVQLGMLPAGLGSTEKHILGRDYMSVMLDGVVVGGVSVTSAAEFVSQLRLLKLCTKPVLQNRSSSSSSSRNSIEGSSSSSSNSNSNVNNNDDDDDDNTIKNISSLPNNLNNMNNLDPTMEIAYIPHSTLKNTAYPGIFLFTQPGRMIRPVFNLTHELIEWVGPMEQVFMNIACTRQDITLGHNIKNNSNHDTTAAATTNNKEDSGDDYITSHLELSPTVMLSQIASFTPYSDYNQSPRNMYQCQMGKQTMGNPTHCWKHRSDNKLYRIQNVQSPLVRTRAYMDYSMDDYPQGVNAVVAVISFTGYDMEDAMIINKASYERGFGHGSMYKTGVYSLDEEEKKNIKDGVRPQFIFSNIKSITKGSSSSSGDEPEDDDHQRQAEEEDQGQEAQRDRVELFHDSLDNDGLPHEGLLIQYGDVICCMVDILTSQVIAIRHKENEPCYVDTVRVIGGTGASGREINTNSGGGGGRPSVTFDLSNNNNNDDDDEGGGGRMHHTSSSGGVSYYRGKNSLRKVSITLRYRRNPVIGDKFSSRHGQKGTLSVLWPQENMPFTEQGMTPDVLINPHAFPSRMTIGMLIESMGGKSGAMHGHYQDATPFQFHEDQRVIDYMGEQLRSSGYSYYGSEPLYNGLTGNIMHADIFIGLVYYQRLRHMVSDKFQARSTGPVVALTRQPVGGRKKHGGIRLGEMERDSLISHGVAFCLQDRLMNCSDTHLAYVCGTCGNLLTVMARTSAALRHVAGSARSAKAQYCSLCESSAGVKPVRLPYVYRFLTNELAAMGVKLSLTLSEY